MRNNSTVSLKAMAYTRITTDLLESSILDCQKSCPFTILIVDSYSAKILSSYLTMSSLLNQGIFTVEHISTRRNRFPNYGSIYFLSPTEKSIKYLVKDFNDLKKPKYNRIYLFFTHRLELNLMEKLVTEGIIARTIFFKELNLSFFSKENNVFDFDFKSGLKIFSCSDDTELKLIMNICVRLFTVCTTMNFHPYIQYQKKSKLCTVLAEKIENLFNENSFSSNMKKEGILLLTDRSLDPTSPLLHDYNYKCLCYDLMDVKENNKIYLNKKKIILSDDDELWRSYKLLHIAEVFNKLANDFDEFQKSDLSKVGNTADMDSFSDMANALTNMSSYKLKTSQLSNQINLAEELNKKYKSNNIYDLIELEQDIISGEKDGNSINIKEIFKNFTITKSKLINQRKDFIRVLLTLYTTLTIGDKDFNVLSGQLSPEEESILKNLSYLGITKNEENKISRRKMTLKNDNISTVSEKISENMIYSSLRSSPMISVIAEQASNFQLDKEKFPFLNWDKDEMPKFQKKYGTKNLFCGDDISNDMSEMEPMIVFNIGGLSYNEISALEKLQKNNLVNHRIIIGSTCLMNASEYIRQLEIIDKSNENEIGIDCLEIDNFIDDKVNIDKGDNNEDPSLIPEEECLI